MSSDPDILTGGGPAPQTPAATTGVAETSRAPRDEPAARLPRGGKPYMSIGEVLNLLKPDFDDVTISKIRFLESEGLIDPERTASGYRKFYQADLDRLRFILKLQRDSYLPLKVIRERLAEYDAGIRPTEGAVESPARAPAPRPEVEVEEDLGESATALHLSESELAGVTGLELSQIQSLKEFGVLCTHGPSGASYYDQDDVIVGRIARDFLSFGIEPRHLKMWRHFAEREAALFEQAVLPMMRHRSPDSRRQATTTLTDLTRLSKKLRHAFLRQSLREYLAGDGS
ncbi:MAG: MerR family transcriptional regulator [Actinomycetota bacterium]|nr:MerR family transcriptional regulator [Actinomycetota bacterium]